MGQSLNFQSINWSWRNQHHAREFYDILLQSIITRDVLAAQILQGIFGFETVVKSYCLNCDSPTNFHNPIQYSLPLALPRQAAPTPTTLDHLQNGTDGHFDHINSVRHCPKCHQRAENIEFARFATAPESARPRTQALHPSRGRLE